MSRESSIAPRERVNITYQSAVGGAQEEVELPLRVLVIGDFLGRPDDRPIEERPTVAIDKESFDKVLASHAIDLALTVPSALDDRGGDLDVRLSIRALRDLRPEAIAEQVPELRRLLELRQALVALKGPLVNRPRFAQGLARVLADPAARDRLIRELAPPSDDALAHAAPSTSET